MILNVKGKILTNLMGCHIHNIQQQIITALKETETKNVIAVGNSEITWNGSLDLQTYPAILKKIRNLIPTIIPIHGGKITTTITTQNKVEVKYNISVIENFLASLLATGILVYMYGKNTLTFELFLLAIFWTWIGVCIGNNLFMKRKIKKFIEMCVKKVS